MKKLKFQESRYITSFIEKKDFPKSSLLEIALLGKSNVGKSSLINHLVNHKLAYTSRTPGKTKMINLFLIDNTCYLIDLPGYGFAKVSKNIKKNWELYIDKYLNSRQHLKLILQLIDARKELSAEDLASIRWAEDRNVPLILVLAKYDKLNNKKNFNHMFFPIKKEVVYIRYSIKDPSCRLILMQAINKILYTKKGSYEPFKR